MRLYRRVFALILAVSMILSLGGCKGEDSSLQTQQTFDQFIASLPPQLVDSSDPSLNLLFSDREAAGFSREPYQWSVYSLEDYLEDEALEKDLYKQLQSYDRSKLTDSQKETYDLLDAVFSISQSGPKGETYYYLANNPLGSFQGVLSGFSTQFYFFNFFSKEDVDSYLSLMETMPEYIAGCLAVEQERQNKGYGLSPNEIQDVQDMCDSIIQGDLTFLSDRFSEKVDEADFLTDSEKAEAKERCVQLLEDGFRKAYQDAKDGLSALDVKQKEYVTLSGVPGGTDYYAYLVRSYSGFDDMEEYAAFLDEKVEEAQWNAYQFMMEHPEAYEKLLEDDIQYTDLQSPQEVLEYLEEAMQQDFPALEKEVDYTMEILPPEMSDLMPSVSAFYLTSILDQPDTPQSMMLSGEYSQSDFLTIAHEGFPGHMYQAVYASQTSRPYIHDIVGVSDYSEGYANYVERFSTRYAADPDTAELYSLLSTYQYMILLQYDYQIHYLGTPMEEVLDSLELLTGSRENALLQYQQLCTMPGAFICYYAAGARFDDLRQEAQDALGSAFDLTQFHESLLKHGPMPIELLSDYVREDLGITSASQGQKAA